MWLERISAFQASGVLVAITVGGSLFGIMGMIVGLPIVSIIYAIITENTNRRLKEKNLEKEFES